MSWDNALNHDNVLLFCRLASNWTCMKRDGLGQNWTHIGRLFFPPTKVLVPNERHLLGTHLCGERVRLWRIRVVHRGNVILDVRGHVSR
jgi:hypothetical protein